MEPAMLGGPPLQWGAESFDDHERRVGRLDVRGEAAQMVRKLEMAGLRGRGGAGFPAARKWQAVLDQGHGRPIVVANGLEGEPASAKDRVLLRHRPHLVLDGVLLAAATVQAEEAIICVRADDAAGFATLIAAIAERRAYGHLPLVPRIEVVPHRYIAGEETALVNWLNGRRMLPSRVPPRPFQKGVRGRPTLVHNIETLAQTAVIARTGIAATTLVTVRGAVARPGVYEVPEGSTVDAVVTAAGGLSENAQAVLVGGYFGRWVDAERASGLRLGHDAALGAGVVAVLPASACGIIETARVAAFLAAERAGQCGPCTFGLPALAHGLEQLARGDVGGGHLDRLTRWAGEVAGRGACRHPDGAAIFISSGLETFVGEARRHSRRSGCHDGGRRVLPIPDPVAA